ncbi:MAG: FAD-dependent monooxygenase [Bryobacteraceae bacterium]|jgi:2-polyprenyl-6-methoxyphenol hydroxylase-like FAD-dependent oxidoreductase
MSKPNLGEYPKIARESRDPQPDQSRIRRKPLQGTGLHTLSIGIIGGGIGGVAAAVALHRAGIQATVYERAPELREVGAGMMLWPNATRVLKDFGLLERVAASSGPNQHFLVRSSAGTILMDIALGQFDVPALCTRRSDLLDALLSALPLERVRLGHDFEYFEHQKNGVRVHFTGAVSAEHDFVIGADGIRSRVRAQLLGVHEPIYRGYTVWRGLAHLKGAVPSGSNSETWGRGKRFGILNTGGDRFTWYATANTDSGHVDSSEGRRRELLRMFAGWHEPVERLIEATDEGSILKNGAYDLAPLKRWGQGRVMLLGDAAHPCTPNLGLGGCMALEDALVLAKSFCKEASPERALRRYESLRRERTRHVQQRSLLMGHIGQWENRVMAGGRRMVTSMLPAKLFERNLRRVYSYAA